MAKNNPNQEMNLLLADQKIPAKNENEAKSDSAGEAGTQDPKQTQTDEEKALDKEAFVGTYMKDKIEDAISYIIAETTSDFKDFQFPMKKMDILYYRMHLVICNRIKELKITEVDNAMGIVKIYRSHHSKAKDIKFLTKSYTMINLQSDNEVMPGVATAAAADAANPMPVPGPSQAAAMGIAEEFETGSSDELAQNDKPNKKKVGNDKRVVRFQTPENYRECFPEDDETEKE